MKKFFKILAIGLGVILLLLLILPFLFKDKISEQVKKALDENLDAKVLLNPDDVSLSLISSFPDFTFGVKNFGIINKAPFEGDTLVYAKSFEVGINFLSVIGGGQIKIGKIALDQPTIHVYVLEDGRANYNITKPSATPETTEAPSEESKFDIKIESWELTGLSLDYFDATSGTMAAIRGLDHSGSGDFTQEVVDLKTKTSIADLSLTMDSANYLMHRKFASEMNLKWNLKEMKGTFGENFVELNAFRFAFAGDMNLGAAKPEFNLTFTTPQTDIKGALSLIPALYAKDFDNVKADGKFNFEGKVKGTYDSTSLPSFEMKMGIANGKIQYPGLSQNVENLNLDMQLSHEQGSLELLKTNIKNFGLKLGQNPVSASGTVEGVSKPNVDIKVNGKVNLADVLAAFPVDGITMKGILAMNLLAKGQYNPETKQFPTVSAAVSLTQGYVKTKDFPQPIEAIEVDMVASNPDGQLASTVVDLKKMHFQLEGEPFDIQANVRDLNNITYQIAAKGSIDLAKITKIFPQEGMTLAGKIKADIKTSGNMADVNDKKYDKLPTSGTMDVSGFTYTAKDLTKPVAISHASAQFNSKEITLSDMAMKIGESDFAMKGAIRNYLAYVLRNETLEGTLQLNSTLMNATELMGLSGTPAPAAKPGEEPPMEASSLPANIDFTFSSNVGKILYDNMVLEQAKGTVSLKNGVLNMKGLQFNTMDGSIGMTGKYDPNVPTRPAFDFTMDMKGISVSKAYQTFNSLKVMAPAAKNVDGKFTTLFKINGFLDKAMKPEMASVNGGGVIKINDGKVKDLQIIKGINSVAKTSLPTEASLKDLVIKAKVENGRVSFEPFDVKAGGQTVTISGSNGLDGTVDYLMKTSVPAGAAGTAAASALSSFTGKTIASPKDVKFEIAATGPGSSPKYRIVKVDAGNVKSEAKAAVNDKINQAKTEAEAKAKAEADRLKQEAEAKAKAEADRLKKEAEDKAKDEINKLKKKFRF